jgi:hypothetical protein
MAISFLLIQNHDVILHNEKSPVADAAVIQEPVASPIDLKKSGDDSISESLTKPVVKTGENQKKILPIDSEQTPNPIPVLLQGVKDYLRQNMLAFIFLEGLTGGFFSVTTRPRSRDFIPGEDAYYTVYILTKPFIGALGAIILYIQMLLLLRFTYVSGT